MGATDRRSLRTRQALRDALAAEIHDVGDLSKVTVTGVTKRADVTRRTFYSHYKDIPYFQNAAEVDLSQSAYQYDLIIQPQEEKGVVNITASSPKFVSDGTFSVVME